MKKQQETFLSLISAPSRRALENENITTLEALSKYSEKDILKLHGIGKSAAQQLRQELKNVGLSYCQ